MMDAQKKRKQNAYRRGQMAEVFAATFLMAKGFVILARRYKSRFGEIDLIAKRGRLVVFVEVKARAKLIDAAYAITPRQQQRIVTASMDWLAHNPQSQDTDLRFDAILIGSKSLMRHIKGAFDADT